MHRIELTIVGKGHQQILNSDFYKEPDSVMVNTITRDDCKKFCDLTEETNNIVLIFMNYITSCDNMFYGSNNITKIDMSNF